MLAYVRANNPSISDPGVCYSKCLPYTMQQDMHCTTPLSVNTENWIQILLRDLQVKESWFEEHQSRLNTPLQGTEM